jgi:hypothetical protein
MAMKKVRILVDCHLGRCNEVVSLNTTEIKEIKQSGLIDDHPDAVRYAEGHLPESSAAPQAEPELPVSPETTETVETVNRSKSGLR